MLNEMKSASGGNKTVVTTGLIAGVVMLVVGLVFNRVFGVLFPSINAEYQDPALFRPWSDPLMSYIFVHPFIVGIVLAWVWDKTKDLFKERDVFWRCCQFASAYWLVTIPGMFISYSTFPVSFTMVFSWSLTGLAQAIAAGWVFVKKNP